MTAKRAKPGSAVEVDRKELGARLREAREYIGLSQEEVSQFLGIPRSGLSMVESGQRRVDALELKRLAALYSRPVDHFTGVQEDVAVFGSSVSHLARKVASLSAADQTELLRFAEFLQARKQQAEG